MAKDKISKELIILGVIVLLYALQGMPTLDFDSYALRFRPLPEKFIFARYALSLGIRIFLLAAAVGIFFRREIFRKIIIYAGVFTVFTVYWKHPVIVYKRILMWKVAQGALPASVIPRIDGLAWASAAASYLVDIIIALGLIYLFTRPKIKRQFQ